MTKWAAAPFERFLDYVCDESRILRTCKSGLIQTRDMVDLVKAVSEYKTQKRKLAEDCPWLNLKVGEQFLINSEHFHYYSEALSKYVWCLLERVTQRLNIPISNFFHKKGNAGSCELWVKEVPQ